MSRRLVATHHRFQHVALRSRTSTLIVPLFVMALVLRAAYAIAAVRVDPILDGNPLLGDAASYDRIARSLVGGTGFSTNTVDPTAFWPPVYPAMLAGIYWLFGHDLMVARQLNALIGACVPVVIFLLGSRLFDRRVALVAALGSAIHPLLIAVGGWLTADGPFVLLVCLLLLQMTFIQEEPTAPRLLLFGVLLGVGVLLKPVTGFFLPMLIPWFLCCVPGPEFLQRFGRGLLTLSAMVLILAPWTIRNEAVMGSPIVGSTNGGYTFYGANNADAFGGHYEYFPAEIPGLSEAEQQQEFYRLGLTWIRDHPSDFLQLEVKKLKRLASPLSIASRPNDLAITGATAIRALYVVFLIGALAGLILTRHSWRRTGLLLIPALAVLVSTLVFYGDVRYTMPMVPSMLLWASVALVATFDAIERRVGGQRADQPESSP
jgi:4-amino-4-deoxy-L-arabinose transferase-like glycosyltransferase